MSGVSLKLSDATVGTVRTTVNVTWMAVLATALARWTGWDIKVADLLPFTPAILGIGAVFYRLSRLVADRFTWIGYVLFGIPRPPIYVEPPSTTSVGGPAASSSS